MPNLGDEFPDFSADTNFGPIKFHEWMGGSWTILFSHPADYTPVCTTELGHVAQIMDEFKKRNVKVIALSCNSTEDHNGWIKDIQAYAKLDGPWPYPIIADPNRDLAVQFGMLDPKEKDKAGLPLTARVVRLFGEIYGFLGIFIIYFISYTLYILFTYFIYFCWVV
jgi:1-Cys peroxiredoxin 6